MNRSRQVWRRIFAALVVATGVAVVWGLAVGWIASSVESLLRPDQVQEMLSIALDGTPVISTQKRIGYNTESVDRRTLDGKPWPADYENWLGSAYLSVAGKPPGLFWNPLPWGGYGDARIGSVDDEKRPPTAWYLVRDDAPAGHMYFAGFDPMTNLSIGYIGKSGYRLAPPLTEEQFAFPKSGQYGVSQFAATTQYIESGRLRTNFYRLNDARPAPWLLYVLDGEQLVEVDLRRRTTRVVLQVPDVTSMSLLQVTQATIGLSSTDDTTTAATGSAPLSDATSTVTVAPMKTYNIVATDSFVPAEENRRPRMTDLIALRMGESVLVYDPPTDRKWTFRLPVDEPMERFSAFFLSPEELLLQVGGGYWSHGPVSQLVWLKNDGTITRRERVELLGWVPTPPRTPAWGLSAVAPVPIAWLVGVVVGYPLELLQENNVDRYIDALRRSWEVCWPPFTVIIVVSAAATWIARKRQQKYRRSATNLWCGFVFLLGVPGLIAYWLEHRQPKLENCCRCGHLVPRDRDECADCRTPFPAPPLVGTEIFA